MPVVWHDSPDYYATAELGRFYDVAHADTIVTTGGYNGADAYSGSTVSAYLIRHLSAIIEAGSPRFGVGARVNVVNTPAANTIVLGLVDEADTMQLSLVLGTDLKLSIWRGNPTTGTSLITSADAISTGVDYAIGLRGLVSVAAGEADALLDGATIALVTGTDTAKTGVSAWSGVYLGCSEDLLLSHVYAGTGDDVLNPGYTVAVLRPDADVLSGWTPSSVGSHAAMIDDVTADDATTVIESSVVGARYAVRLDTLAATRAILGVQTVALVKNVAGIVASYAPLVYDVDGHAHVAPHQSITDGAWRAVSRYDAVNPKTGAPWRTAEVNATAFGGETQG